MRRMETAICSSVTVRMRSTSGAAVSKALLPICGNGETVGERGLGLDPDWFSFPHGCRKTGDVFRFHRNDPGLRPQTFDGKCHSRQQATAAHGHDHGIQIGHLLHDFESHCALPGDDGWIVVAIDVSEATFIPDAHGHAPSPPQNPFRAKRRSRRASGNYRS